MKKEDVQTKIDVILDGIDKLKFLRSKTYEEFISDFRNLYASLHILQTSIQALLDIGCYIIASLGLKTPNTNAEIINILKDNELVPKDKTETYIKMGQFRNRIVHLYNHIDAKTLYDILVNELDDIKGFYSDLIRIIQANKE